MKRCLILILMVCGVSFFSGCTTVPYQYGSIEDFHRGPPLAEGEPQFDIGDPNAFLDASDWIWPGSLFSKLILWNHKVDSHEISPETIDVLRRYLGLNNLERVKVRINSYRPGAEWIRTMRNHSIAPPYRYTLGFISWLGYTIMPGRFFGGDNYNPYSNTINIYSDIAAVALHEGGHGKDFARRRFKGTYAFAYMLPLFNLYPEAVATSDALSYLYEQEEFEEYRNAYKILYPAYGTYIGSNIGEWVTYPWNYACYAGGVIPGHIVGRIKAAAVEETE